MKEYNSIYLGIVIQNNDPEKRGRVKVFVPHISPTIYNGWVESNVDKNFSFIGLNINSSITPILENLKAVLPWAETSAPLTSENASGRFNNFSLQATVSDTNIYSNLSAADSSSSGELYDESLFRLTDAFAVSGNNVNNPNPYSYMYKPNTYSNKAKGSFGIPSVGAHVYTFFRDGNPQFPVLIGATYGKDDWQGIYDNEVDYPGKFENASQGITEMDHNVQTYRNKYVLNQKGGTLEISNTDFNEKVKLTQYSGSFKEMNNNANIELATKNAQRLVLNDSYDTVKGFKNEYTGKSLDEIVFRDKYKKVGNINNYETVKEWKEIYSTIQDQKQLFDTQRAQANNIINSDGAVIIKRNSVKQIRSGTFAEFDVTSVRNKNNALMNSNPRSSSGIAADTNTSTFANVPFYDGILKTLGTSPPQPLAPVNFQQSTDAENWKKETGNVFPFGDGLSMSSEGGQWSPDTTKKNLVATITEKIDKMMQLEKDFGKGGSEIIEIAKHKLETIGTVMNDSGSIKYDAIGKLLSNEVVVGSDGVYTNKDSGPLLEYVDVQEMPGGTYTLNVCNKFNVMVGAGGLNLKSYGPTNLTGSITNITGQQVNIGSDNEVNIDAKVINISAEILKLRNKRQRQILIENSLGVSSNVVIGGGLHVEGEVYVQHISAPVEFQVTETTQALGQPATDAPFAYILAGTFLGIGNEGAPVSAGQNIPVFGGLQPGIPAVDTLITYPHTHAFRNIPLTLYEGNEDLRNAATNSGINTGGAVVSTAQQNTYKSSNTADLN